ncbi:hypothetical protein SZ64_11075 [Erythrobacter sp. SG61-1L]|uniref:hypothetical protein n=1 Tax=Erythrobacter sp. SG61-1L TaxID=1603897 RepID=UPI0006D6B9ED|nr:hypothetical protein [Erythrobacter sp. SG61-1L]KPL68598.1 hypothetical protein SZ64_11075 [Erythrobacter sp. SG61-1L]
MTPRLTAAFTASLAALALSACGSSDETNDTAAPQSEAPATTPAPSASIETPALPDAIPAAMQGRWGLVPADCTSTRGDAKGLLVIGPEKLTFYESVGTLDTVKEGDNNRLLASFAYTGEGMSWAREEELTLDASGKQLVRVEHGEGAMPQPLTYNRCA